MILAGPKSYYDEYLRKKGTNKTLADPPSLLTDRGAYVNFLEVQLERVSAACLGVQSYEERFQDMQGMITALEQRCSSMTRLLSLAQQCTEEVRVEATQTIDRVTKEFQLHKIEQQRINDSYQQRIEHLETMLRDTLPDHSSRLKLMNKKIDEQEQLQQAHYDELSQQNQQLNEQCQTLTAAHSELQQLIESNRATISRVTFDVEEHTSRANGFLRKAEERLQQRADEQKEQLKMKLSAVESKVSQELENARQQWDMQSMDIQSTIREHYGKMSREVSLMRSQCEEDIESVAAKVQDDLEQRYGKLKKTVDQSVVEMKSEGERQRGQLLQLEEDILTHVGGVEHSVSKLSDRHEHLSAAYDKSQLVTAGEITTLSKRTQRQSELFGELDSKVASFVEDNSRCISAVEGQLRSLHEEAMTSSQILEEKRKADKDELLKLHEEVVNSSRLLEDKQREDREHLQRLAEDTLNMSRVMEEHHKQDQEQIHELEEHERHDVEILRKEQQEELKRIHEEEQMWHKEQSQQMKKLEDGQARQFEQWQQQQHQQYYMFSHDSVPGSPSVILPPQQYQFAATNRSDPRFYSPTRQYGYFPPQSMGTNILPANHSLLPSDTQGVGGPMSARKPVKGVTIDIPPSQEASFEKARPSHLGSQRGPHQRPHRPQTVRFPHDGDDTSSRSSGSYHSHDHNNHETLRKALTTLLTSHTKDPNTIHRLLEALTGDSAAGNKEIPSVRRGEEMLRSFMKSYNRDKREILQRLRELSPKRTNKAAGTSDSGSERVAGISTGRCSRSSSPSQINTDTATSVRRKQPLTKEEAGMLAKCREDFLAKQNEEWNKTVETNIVQDDEQSSNISAVEKPDQLASGCTTTLPATDSVAQKMGSEQPYTSVSNGSTSLTEKVSYPVDHRLSSSRRFSDAELSKHRMKHRKVSPSYGLTEKQANAAVDDILEMTASQSSSPLRSTTFNIPQQRPWIPTNTFQPPERRLSPQTLQFQQDKCIPESGRIASKGSSVVSSTTTTSQQQ